MELVLPTQGEVKVLRTEGLIISVPRIEHGTVQVPSLVHAISGRNDRLRTVRQFYSLVIHPSGTSVQRFLRPSSSRFRAIILLFEAL